MNLSGINLGSLIEGIHIWRPLLSHSKAEILDFAHLFGIPYLKNSTPIWSTRGKIRNQET
jgi:tRNA(Ile)-lysidine synthase TilS/MesJ